MSANFRSDNETPMAQAILEALSEANTGTAWAYAEDDWSNRLDGEFSELFETQVSVLPVATGTVANAIALASVTPPWGAVFCHRGAHIYCDESGAPEFYGSGLRLVPVEGDAGKLTPDGLRQAIDGAAGHGVHSYTPSALSLTQCTESGTVYRPREIDELCKVALNEGMSTHIDGARFANALAGLGCAPADSSWRAGVQMLSFGASKNGCMAAEALVIFGRGELIENAERLRKRGGHLISKMRYVSAQLLAYIRNGLWLELARHANAQAAEFADAVELHPEASLEFPVQANEVFVRWSPGGLESLLQKDVEFHYVPGHDELARFVFAHSTTPGETRFLIEAMGS